VSDWLRFYVPLNKVGILLQLR